MGYPTQDTTNDFPALPIPPKKQQPTADDFPIIKKKVGTVPSKVGGQVGTSVPQLAGDIFKGTKAEITPGLDEYAKIQEHTDPLLSAQREAEVIKINPTKEGFDKFSKVSQQARNINGVVSTNGYVGDNFVGKLIGDDPNKYSIQQLHDKTKDNVTGQAALGGIADKRKVEDAIKTTTDPYRAAVKYSTGKENEFQNDITDEEKGEAFKNFMNNPNTIELAKTNPEFGKAFKQAKSNWMDEFPSAAQKDIKEKIAKKLVDDGKTGLFTVPSNEEIDKAASDVLDSHEMSIYKNDLKPNIGTLKELLNGQTIPTPDIVHTALRAFNRGGGDLYEGTRHFVDNLSLGTVSALGEGADERQKRMLEKDFSTPQVEAKGKVAQTVNSAVDMAAYMVPSILGSVAGAPAMATLGAQFYGNNWVNGMKLFRDDKAKQEGYATLTTALDLIAGEKLPIKGAGDAIKSIIDDVESGAISKTTGKEKFLNFITDTFHGTNALKAMQIGHNAAEKVFEGKNIDLEEDVKNAIKTYPQDAIPMAFFSGVAHGANALGKEAPKPPEEQPILESKPELNEQENKAIEEINKRDLSKTGLAHFVAPFKDPNATVEQKRDALKQIHDQLTASGTEITTGEQLGKAADAVYDLGYAKPMESDEIKKTLSNESKNITPENNFQTMNMGNDEGQPETKEARERMKERFSQGDIPVDGENGKGETGRQFASRVLGQWEKTKSDEQNNTTVVTHSSVLKAIKAYEGMKDKPEDPDNFSPEQWKEFSDAYNKESTDNGDLETFKGTNGDIHVIRHGQTEDNEQNKFRSGNTPLTEKGVDQAHEVGKQLQEKTNGEVPKIISSDLPRAIHSSNIINDQLAATPKETVNETKPKVRVTADQLEAAQPKETPPPITLIEPKEVEGAKLTGITHEETQRTREEFGLGNEYEKKTKTDKELYDKAESEIKKGYDINSLLSSIEGGKHPNDTETTILKIYKANLEAKIEKDPSDKNLSELLRLVKATDVAGSEQGRAFRARQGGELRDDSFASFFIDESTANNDAPLTDKQKETAKTDFSKLKSAKQEANDAEAKLQEVASKEAASNEVNKAAKTVKRTKKTHEDFVKERKSIVESAREALKKARGETSATILPYAKELVAIAPHVAKMVKSLAEEGVVKLEEVVKAIHEHFKDDIKDLKPKDIHDIIAGEYNEKNKGTKKEAAIVAENLRVEAQLINKLDRLENGTEPKNEKAKVQRNQQIHDLRQKIGAFRRENPDYEGKLKQLTERNKKETERIKDKIENGEFEPEAKRLPLLEQRHLQKQFPQEFLKAQRSQDALIKVRNEIAIRRASQMYENKSPQEKTMEIFAKTLNIPRTMMASFDFSAPLRQGIVASAAHPVMASKAMRFMFEAAKNEKVYNRWLDMVHNSDRWNAAQKTDLGITDPASLHLKEREEAFQGAPYAEKIPIIGLGIKASERAYIGYLNHLRWNLFNMYADRFEAMGKTYENNPELYKGISSFINSSTGRGNLEGKLNNAAPLLNSFLFATKLMASRINMLGLSDIPNLLVRGATLGKRGLDYGFYTKLPKEIRVEALKDMAKFVGVGMSVLLTAKMMGANVEDDPRSSDFGKIHIGNTRWDIWGGFQPYARVLTQFITGERKATTTGDIQELNGKGFMGQTRATPLTSFLRAKLAPVPGTAWNLIEGSDVVGNKVTPQGELLKSIVPLLGQDIYQAMQDQGVKAIFTVGIPSAFGVGVQTFQPKIGQGGGKMGGGGAKGDYKKSNHKQVKSN